MLKWHKKVVITCYFIVTIQANGYKSFDRSTNNNRETLQRINGVIASDTSNFSTVSPSFRKSNNVTINNSLPATTSLTPSSILLKNASSISSAPMRIVVNENINNVMTPMRKDEEFNETISTNKPTNIEEINPPTNPFQNTSLITTMSPTAPNETLPPFDTEENIIHPAYTNDFIESDSIYTLETNKSETTGSYGSMFSVRARDQKVVITLFSFFTDVTTPVTYYLYTLKGQFSFQDINIDEWNLISNGTVYGRGRSEFTPVYSNMSLVFLEPNEVQSFFMTLSTYDLRYSASHVPFGYVANQDDHIEILAGAGIGDFPVPYTIFEPRLFHGSIDYFVWNLPSDVPSVFPSDIPTLTPSITPTLSTVPTFSPSTNPTRLDTSSPTIYVEQVSTSQIITLFGSDLTMMDGGAADSFSSSVHDFLMEQIKKQNPTMNITHVVIQEQSITEIPIARNRYLRVASLDVQTSITGEYQPPPEISFDAVVEDSIQTKSDELVEKLKETKVPVFQKVEEVHAVTIQTNENNTIIVEEPDEITPFQESIGGIIVFGMLGLTLICCCFALWRICRNWSLRASNDDEFNAITDILAEKYARQEYSQNIWAGSDKASEYNLKH